MSRLPLRDCSGSQQHMMRSRSSSDWPLRTSHVQTERYPSTHPRSRLLHGQESPAREQSPCRTLSEFRWRSRSRRTGRWYSCRSKGYWRESQQNVRRIAGPIHLQVDAVQSRYNWGISRGAVTNWLCCCSKLPYPDHELVLLLAGSARLLGVNVGKNVQHDIGLNVVGLNVRKVFW